MPLVPSTRKTLEFLGVHRAEERSVALMLGHSFFMGTATVFFETAASAAFLSRFASSYLPWVYIAAAGVNTVTGATYARLQQRASFARMMKGTLWFLFALVVAVRAGFAASGLAWVAFAGLVSYRVISSLTDLEYWAVASRIYDVRQAKRLFGLIGTGEVVARIAGAFAVPFLVGIGGVSNLMLISAVALAICIALLSAVLRRGDLPAPSPKPTAPPRAAESPLQGIRAIVASPYLALVVTVAVLATFGKYFVDFAFLEQMSTQATGEEKLASLLGLFSGLTQTLSLLTRVFVSRPLLQRFGIRVGVVVLPLLHLACTVGTILSGVLGAGGSAVFWFVIANQGIYKSFKHPIDNASFKVLYQPLDPQHRLTAQIAVEIIFSPFVAGLAGGVMLLFSTGMAYDPVRFSFVLLVNFVLWAIAARAAGRRYIRAILDMLRGPIERNVPFVFDDATTLSTLRARLESASHAEVCAALTLLEKAEAPDIVAVLVARLAHPAVEVRLFALDRLLAIDPSALRSVRRRLSTDPEPSVRGAAVRALAAGDRAWAVDEIVPYLDDGESIVRRAAVAALFDSDDDKGRGAAREAIERFAASARADDRKLAAQLAGDYAVEHLLKKLVVDADPNVRRAALVASGHAPESRRDLVDVLSEPRFAQSAAKALALGGDDALSEIEAAFRRTTDRRALRWLVNVLVAIGTPKAAETLRAHRDHPDAALRTDVLAGLDRLGYVAGEAERDTILVGLVEEAREATWTLGAIRDLTNEADLGPLRRALEDEVTMAGRRLAHALALTHDSVAIHRARHNVVHPSKDKRAYALEVFDVVLDSDHRETFVPLLDESSSESRLARLEDHFPQGARSADDRVCEIIARADRWVTPWTRALAIRAAAQRRLPAAAAILAKHRASDPIELETTAWALDRLHERPTKENERMLLIERVLILKTVHMFASASEEVLGEIAGILEEIAVPKGTIVLSKGDVGDSMYIVTRGAVRVFDGERTLSRLGEKEIFGELALLDPQPRSASVEAVEDSRLFRLDADTFSQLMAGNLEIVRGVLHVLCQRLRRTSAGAGDGG